MYTRTCAKVACFHSRVANPRGSWLSRAIAFSSCSTIFERTERIRLENAATLMCIMFLEQAALRSNHKQSWDEQKHQWVAGGQASLAGWLIIVIIALAVAALACLVPRTWTCFTYWETPHNKLMHKLTNTHLYRCTVLETIWGIRLRSFTGVAENAQ